MSNRLRFAGNALAAALIATGLTACAHNAPSEPAMKFKRRRFAILTLAIVLAASAAAIVIAASAAETVPATRMLAAHNKVRSRHGVPPLSWSESLARDAGAWADHLAKDRGCTMQHTTSAGEGENLYWASAMTWSDGRRDAQSVAPEHVIKNWAAEETDYDYARNSCRAGKACGHYTQIVWKNSKSVGCAKRTCSDKSQVWVCRYSPPGNWVGKKPY